MNTDIFIMNSVMLMASYICSPLSLQSYSSTMSVWKKWFSLTSSSQA